MVFDSLRKYVYDRRRGLISAAAFVGGTYIAGRYALRRLEEVRERLIEDKTAKENLRNRFIRNQEDCIFTSQALVPTFGNQVLEELDVEGLTHQIQLYGKAGSGGPEPLSSSITIDGSAVSQIVEVGPMSPPESVESPTTHETVFPSQDVSQSWVDEFSASQPQDLPLPPATPSEGSPLTSSTGFLASESGENASELGDLGGSQSSTDMDAQSVIHVSEMTIPSQRDVERSLAPSPPPPRTKTKAELWKELRTMTFTRTVTLIYTLALLTLQTHVQLNILASFKYVQSVVEMEAEQKDREASSWGDVFPIELESNLRGLFGSTSFAPSPPNWLGNDVDETDASHRTAVPRITELTERRYLTMNWWLLNVGWKAVMDRVHAAVAEVFDRVPLKSELSAADLRERISQVRLKVEHEVVKEGGDGEELSAEERARLQGAPEAPREEQRTDFLPILLPISPATEQQALLSGGLSPEDVLLAPDDRVFRNLMDQTASFIRSRDFEIVFDKAMDTCIDLFVDDMNEAFSGDEERRVRLAALLPSVARWSHLAVNAMPNELIEGISRLPQVSAFSAIIFSSYEERLRYGS